MWDLKEAVAYYRSQGAPGQQSALIELLKEAQQENGGSLPGWLVEALAAELSAPKSLLLGLIRRIPSLRLADTHCLELCGGPNCSRKAALADFVEKNYRNVPGLTVRQVGCMRQCAKGPNLRFDGRLYNGADEGLIRSLLDNLGK